MIEPRRGLERLDEAIVRVTTWVALAFLISLLGAGVASSDSAFFAEALNPAVVAAVGLVMMVRGRPQAAIQMMAGAITVALTVGVFEIGSRSSALFGLVSIGIIAALLVRKYIVAFLVAGAVGLFLTAYWWNVGDWIGRERVAEAFVPPLAFLLAAGLFAWLKKELHIEGERRNEALLAMESSERQFRMAFESSATTMALLDVADGRFLRINRAGCEALGYTEEEMLGMTTADIIHPEEVAESRGRLARLLSGELTQATAVLRILRKDGSIVPGLVSTGLVTDGQGNPLHFVSQVVDLSEQHEAEQQLLDLIASRDELIASVSHELRTPLTAVMGYASVLLESVPGPPPDDYELMLSDIVGQGSDLVAIIEDLLVFAQSDANTLRVSADSVDLRDQVTVVLETLRTDLSVEHVKVTGPRVAGHGDPLRVRQILRNLLTNAGRYGGDAIDISLEEDDDSVSVVVSDNGQGIPEADRDLVFEPYQRSRPRDGLTASIGVGLTVARRLARLMDGDLGYEYRDGASRFTLRLPAAAYEEATPSGEQREDAVTI